jgi:hypothetical protein
MTTSLKKIIYVLSLLGALPMQAMESVEPWQLIPNELKTSIFALVQPSENLKVALKQWLQLRGTSKEWKDLVDNEFTQKAWISIYNERYPQGISQGFYKGLKDTIIPLVVFLLKTKAVDPNCSFIWGPAKLDDPQREVCLFLPQEIDTDFMEVEDLPSNYKEETPLLIAAESSSIPLIQELIKAGADVNLEITKRLTHLLEAKAEQISDPTLQQKWKKLLTLQCGQLKAPVLPHVFFYAHEDTIKFLLNAGAQIGSNEMVHALVMSDKLSTVALLLNYGLNVDIQDKAQSRTLLAVAVQYGFVAMVKLLLEHGADGSIVDCFGRTPLDMAWQGLLSCNTAMSGNVKKTKLELEQDYQQIIKLLQSYPRDSKKRKRIERIL